MSTTREMKAIHKPSGRLGQITDITKCLEDGIEKISRYKFISDDEAHGIGFSDSESGREYHKAILKCGGFWYSPDVIEVCQ